mmetsp:Transcript_21312/g.25908  ORF Transcript_21312/g.25908 Transcript_21312/m.25908 type:complete len:550 (-) Transcript_21312:186-1835(-)|eukprot:CAMPEP_0204828446 /NCGR_PEP_ID=MMETSP1346-20131115/6204_1 /ASSEMBLY_ACC=CAM_ASM_000771 /TAXON_ID=215587 /ORGANISM="Aplanochytrium stocchinoi, Strain GSBS06" /LENGTH=549 /DNA_ID=CAMNT_0051957521 /DNA_START=87 /DNA_END=1736 /DNA_ORIENTATION=-
MPWLWKGKGKQQKKADSGGIQNVLPKPPVDHFSNANPWKPDEHVVIYCMNGKDNVPDKVRLENDFVFYISQCRSPGHKDQGQDCLSSARHKNWEVHVLCDGHDRQGHMVALGVCHQLPAIVLRRLHERPKKEWDEVPNEDLIAAAFDETSDTVCWTNDNITVGLWVKVNEGQWANQAGYIKEATGTGKVRVAIIDENGYHLPQIDRKHLLKPRYTGGCTAVCFMRNHKTNECRVAISGDSRFVVMPTLGVKSDHVMVPTKGLEPETEGEEPPECLLTPAHNVVNYDERNRLQTYHAGQFEIEDNFLLNPVTKFAIQPTRGFGDFDMFGTGYTHKPEIGCPFTLQPNSLVFIASDGVFDEHVWQDEEIISCLAKHVEEGDNTLRIVDSMYRETLARSLEGGYVDDISCICFKVPADAVVAAAEAEEIEKEQEIKEDEKSRVVEKKKEKKEKRNTLQRGAPAFTDLEKRLQDLQAARGKADIDAENDDEPERVEEIGNQMKRLAKNKGIDYDALDSKGMVTGKSFSNLADLVGDLDSQGSDFDEESDMEGG